MEAGKKRLNGDVERSATKNELKELREQNAELKDLVVALKDAQFFY